MDSKGFSFDYSSVDPTSLNSTWDWPAIMGDSMIYDFYPDFIDTAAMDFRLKTCSPLVNRGYNQAAQDAGLLYDLDGAARIRFGRVDMGAYETQDSCFKTGTGEPRVAETPAFSLQPNVLAPGESFRVQAPADAQARAWQIVDVSGRIAAAGQGDWPGILVAPQMAGVYFLRLVVGEERVCLRFLVQ